MSKKPSPRGNFNYRARIKCNWWKPERISLAPYHCHELTDTPNALRFAKLRYVEGKPELLIKWLADTAGERRAYWAAYDAMHAPAMRLAA